MSDERDTMEGRVGEWMHTASGGRFFPLDPRPEDFCLNDLANGMALDCRYGGQGRVDRFYSVAEHSVHVARAVHRWQARGKVAFGPKLRLLALLHDAPEGLLRDMPRAIKHSMRDVSYGSAYDILADMLELQVLVKYDLVDLYKNQAAWAIVKEADERIIPLEKAFVCYHPEQPWASDVREPLEDTTIWGLSPAAAKKAFAHEYYRICRQLPGVTPEVIHA